MKKIGLLFVIVAAFFLLPFSVLADSENVDNSEAESNEEVDAGTDEEENKEVKVYFFHGDGCPHCAEAKEFFDSIEEEYGHLFEIIAYETWKDAKNAALLQEIAEVREEKIEGVPYILIGNKSWPGYRDTLNESIIEAIKEEYEIPVDERYDIAELIDFTTEEETEIDYSSDVMTLIIILIVGAGIVTGIVFARKKAA